MIAVPYPLKMEAKGILLPVEIAQIFPAREGQVRAISRKPGEKVGSNEAVVDLFSSELQKDYSQAQNGFLHAQGKVETLKRAINELGMAEVNQSKRLEPELQLSDARDAKDSAEREMKALVKAYNMDLHAPAASSR